MKFSANAAQLTNKFSAVATGVIGFDNFLKCRLKLGRQKSAAVIAWFNYIIKLAE